MEILGIIAFVVALLTSVMFHELGHFLTARKFGMRVSEFFVGFGRTSGQLLEEKPSTESRLFLPADIAASKV
jgi:membrane-associated protease RseP (regulator of RpoE activity)